MNDHQISQQPRSRGRSQGKNGKLRILYIVTQADRGGAQMHLLSLVKSMVLEFDVHLAVGEEGFLTEACRQKGITVHILHHLRRSAGMISDLKALNETRNLLKAIRPELIHVHTFKAGFIGRLAAWSLGIPAIYTVHAWLWGTKAVSKIASRAALPLERLSARWCDQIITVSHAGEELVRKCHIAGDKRVVTIHNGIEDFKVERRNAGNKAPVLMMVARFTAGKDFGLLIKAFASVSDRAHLWLVGDGETRKAMETLAADLGIASQVSFWGECENVQELLSRVDVFVLASESEMLPISILEAMRAGVPVVASNVGGVREAVTDGETGLLVPKGDVGALKEALERLIADEALRTRLGLEGRRAFESRFRSSIMANSTYQMYVQVLRQRGARQISPLMKPQLVDPQKH